MHCTTAASVPTPSQALLSQTTLSFLLLLPLPPNLALLSFPFPEIIFAFLPSTELVSSSSSVIASDEEFVVAPGV